MESDFESKAAIARIKPCRQGNFFRFYCQGHLFYIFMAEETWCEKYKYLKM